MLSKSAQLPSDIPAHPWTVYANAGWVGMGDWLGTGRVKYGQQQYLPFKDARHYARSLCLKSLTEWKAYCKSGKPRSIPAHPEYVYATEWVNWGDWLGTNRAWLGPGQRRGGWPPFEEARSIARALGLASTKEWRAYVKTKRLWGKVPANPDFVYRERGWVSWGDWLGTNRTSKKLPGP
jgi:hypothetical protein